MKKTICAILVIVIFSAMVMGCNKTKDEDGYVCVLPSISYDEDVSGFAENTEATSAEIKDMSYYIRDHQDSKVYFEDDYSIEYTIPEILIDSNYARECNAEIYAIAQKDLLEQDGTYSIVWGMKYDCYLNENILSVVMNHHTMTGNNHYSIYNIDVLTGERVTDEQIVEAAGLTMEEYNNGLKDAHMEGIRIGWFIPEDKTIDEYIAESVKHYGSVSFLEEQMANTLSEENMKKAQVYLADNGDLWLANKIYSNGGADYYERLFSYSAE